MSWKRLLPLVAGTSVSSKQEDWLERSSGCTRSGSTSVPTRSGSTSVRVLAVAEGMVEVLAEVTREREASRWGHHWQTCRSCFSSLRRSSEKPGHSEQGGRGHHPSCQ